MDTEKMDLIVLITIITILLFLSQICYLTHNQYMTNLIILKNDLNIIQDISYSHQLKMNQHVQFSFKMFKVILNNADKTIKKLITT